MTIQTTAKAAAGFTLVEMLVVLAMLGILAVLVKPVVEIVAQREREQQLRRALWTLRDAIDEYKRAHETGALPLVPGESLYPPTLQALTKLYQDARPQTQAPAQARQIRFLRAVPRDPFADSKLSPESSWALRAFLSEASDPKPGVDVYDVHSTSQGRALDGSLLKDW